MKHSCTTQVLFQLDLYLLKENTSIDKKNLWSLNFKKKKKKTLATTVLCTKLVILRLHLEEKKNETACYSRLPFRSHQFLFSQGINSIKFTPLHNTKQVTYLHHKTNNTFTQYSKTRLEFSNTACYWRLIKHNSMLKFI